MSAKEMRMQVQSTSKEKQFKNYRNYMQLILMKIFSRSSIMSQFPVLKDTFWTHEDSIILYTEQCRLVLYHYEMTGVFTCTVVRISVVVFEGM
jgi:hypothetical protein